MLVRFDVVRLGKADKGMAKLFLAKTTDLSRARLTRLLRRRVTPTTTSWSRARTPTSCAAGWATPHIPLRFAPMVNDFTQFVLSPAVNHHRPCKFAVEHVDTKDEAADATRTIRSPPPRMEHSVSH